LDVHTHLKGRIFNTEGVSYLVLQEQDDSPEWLKVKSLNSSRTVRRMHCDEVQKLLTVPMAR
jgi:hypothetical protein